MKNEYNPDVAEQRAKNLFANAWKLIEGQRHSAQIDTVCLALLGDFISGYIHEELEESNAMSPLEATMYVQGLLTSGIEFLLGKGLKLVVPCCIGNHGRTTKKRRIKTAAKNSFEFMMYCQMANHFGDRVDFRISEGYHNIVEQFGYNLRFHHGDAIGYNGGMGGPTISANKKIGNWNKTQPAYQDIFGHLHTWIGDEVFFMLNGSLIGHNPFAVRIGAPYQPPIQGFFLMEKRGKTGTFPINVD